MAHEEVNEVILTKEEKIYNDLIRRGDDFFKIELFKSARGMFEEAMKYKPNDEATKSKIAECRRLVRRDTKRVIAILPFLIIIVSTVIWYKCH